MSGWLDTVSRTVAAIGTNFERGNQIMGQMRARDVESTRSDPYQSFYRTEVLDARNAQDIGALARAFGELSDGLGVLESDVF
jgi:hypothetical protein